MANESSAYLRHPESPQNPPKSGDSLRSRLAAFYQRHARYAGIAIFSLGFLWDSLTLTRVDNLTDNIILLFYLIAIAFMIILTLRRQGGKAPARWVLNFEPHFPWAMQFCFGGLFSSYVIFYFKSASWTRTQFFFLILVLLWIGNEFLQHRLQNPKLLAILYCFCLFSFLAFFLPVVWARVDAWIFFAAGLISLSVSLIVFFFGLAELSGQIKRPMSAAVFWILCTWLGLNILYFADLIPPVPLALKSAGIYHEVVRTADGYQVKFVPHSRYRFRMQWDDPFHFTPGEKVYCYTAVFAPKKIRVPVSHVWSHKTEHGWIATDRIGFEISGGRQGGYRGFTGKSGITPGKWRVEVQTEGGRILGRIDFTVIAGSSPHPPLVTELIR